MTLSFAPMRRLLFVRRIIQLHDLAGRTLGAPTSNGLNALFPRLHIHDLRKVRFLGGLFIRWIHLV
jgi:hypothetical protein